MDAPTGRRRSNRTWVQSTGAERLGGAGDAGMTREVSAKDRRHFRAWTTLVIASQAAMVWGLQLPAGFLSSLGVNLGFFGLLGAAVGVTRRVSPSIRFGPAVIGTVVVGAMASLFWLVLRDDQLVVAWATTVVLFALMIAVVSALVTLSRRGLIVQTPLRRNLLLGLVVWMIVSALISWPVDVWKGLMGVAALAALFAILIWPSRGEVKPTVGRF